MSLMFQYGRWAALILAVAALGCWSNKSDPVGPEADGGPEWFEDVTDAVGLDFVHDPGPTDTYFMPQIMGSGAAFIHDGDGTLYVYLLQNAGPKSGSVNRLYRREADGKFRDVTAGSGLDVPGFNMGAAVADINNDGLPDVLVTQFCGARLFLNLGAGRFEDVTTAAGLNNPVWGTSAAFFDYDRDGWLDLVITNYVEYNPKSECQSARGTRDFCGPMGLPPVCSRLFHNLGPNTGSRVKFEDVSFDSGLGRVPGPGLGVVCADFDGDGWPDVFVANDAQPNRLWINRRNGTFVDEAMSRGVAYTTTGKAFANMGIALGDVANTGMLDIYVTHLMRETNTLWRQGPRGQFRDRSVEAGLTTTRWQGTGFGTLMADFDLDGAVDIAVANGRINRDGPANAPGLGFWESYAERNQIFANSGTGTFRDLSPGNKAFCGPWNVARGLACADVDGDGAPDLLITTIGNRARLYRNVAPGRGHWLTVRAIDPRWKRDAYGAEVRVKSGGVERLRLINPAQSYLSSGTPLALFGLGQATLIDSIRVVWPDGTKEAFPGGAVDRSIVLRRGEGKPE